MSVSESKSVSESLPNIDDERERPRATAGSTGEVVGLVLVLLLVTDKERTVDATGGGSIREADEESTE